MNIRANEREGKAGDMSVHEILSVWWCLCLSGSGLLEHHGPHLSAFNQSLSTCICVCMCVCTICDHEGQASGFRHAVCFSGAWHESPLLLQLFLHIHKHDIEEHELKWTSLIPLSYTPAVSEKPHCWCRFFEYSCSSIRWQPHFFGSQVKCHEALWYLPINNNEHIEQWIKL